jgi:hypothetical protein
MGSVQLERIDQGETRSPNHVTFRDAPQPL